MWPGQGRRPPYIVRVSSSPAARGTRAERGGTSAGPAARRAFPEPDDTTPASGNPAGRAGTPTVIEDRVRPQLREPERQLLVSLGLTAAVILFITVVLPMLISLVRNF